MDTALQSSVYVSSPEFAGWLMKRGFHWRKLWKRRWVALHGAEIVYMDKEPTVENSATMTITKAQITTATVIDRDDIDGNPNGFAIHINDGHTPTWYLRAESAREKKSWLMRLSHVHAIVRWLEDFEKVKVLGVGGTGIVYELLHKSNGQRFAMKEMEIKNKAQMTMAISEAEMLKDIMENISHPNIMHIEKVFQVGSKFYLVFPLCTGGELYEHIIRRGHFTEHDAAIILRDLISGLHALHEHDILHLDIKPENLLFDSMGDNAKIKITDFGLSKLFSQQTSQQKAKFSMQLMEERLRTLVETGELNREKLRGTIGYMAPELILTGHCSKATDVFAAGVVLYILLCGRPPFNSKSNREVLEKTARGQFTLTGAEWDDISPEAKDLVAKMLVVNPEERISTSDILAHPWIKQLDEETDDLSSTSSASEIASSSLPISPKSLSGSRSLHRKGTGPNLVNALRHLSGHVKQLRSEKFATNVTKLVSLMQSSGANKSTLAKMYLIPIHNSPSPNPSNPSNSSSNPDKEEGGAASIIQSEDINDEEFETLVLNPDLRDGFAAAIRNISDGESGRLSLDQFIALLKYLHNFSQSPGSGPGGQGLGPLIISKFIDRDNDGYITADDIFAAQALLMQRSEIFLKVIFRIYAEAIWYPGRQLNLRSMLSQTPVKGGAGEGGAGGNTTPGGSRVLTSESNLPAVVEPPKFITARHVAAVFEKLGYEPAGGQKAFSVLCEALTRFKTENKDRIDEADERESTAGGSPERLSPVPPPPPTIATPNAALAKAFEDMDDGETPRRSGKFGVPELSRESSKQLGDGQTGQSSGSSPTPNCRMDLQDFVKATELDDVLIQVIFRKARYRMVSILHEAESKMRTLSMSEMETQSEKNSRPKAASSEDIDMMKRKPRLSSKDITAELIEEELKSALNISRASETAARPTFPIANAVGRATLNAALGLATKVAIGTQALMEATYETFEAEEASPNNRTTSTSKLTPSTSSSRLSSTNKSSSMKGIQALAGVDSDDEA